MQYQYSIYIIYVYYKKTYYELHQIQFMRPNLLTAQRLSQSS